MKRHAKDRAAMAVRVLKDARKKIANREHTYICLAISASHYGTFPLREELKGQVMAALEGENSFTSWMLSHGYSWGQALSCDLPRRLRLKWLDKWIGEIKEANNL